MAWRFAALLMTKSPSGRTLAIHHGEMAGSPLVRLCAAPYTFTLYKCKVGESGILIVEREDLGSSALEFNVAPFEIKSLTTAFTNTIAFQKQTLSCTNASDAPDN